MTQVNKHEFDLWLIDPTTLKLVEYLKKALIDARRDLADSNFLMEPNNSKEIGYKVGYKDCIQYLLLSVFQQQEDEEQEDASMSTFGTSSPSEIEEDRKR